MFNRIHSIIKKVDDYGLIRIFINVEGVIEVNYFYITKYIISAYELKKAFEIIRKNPIYIEFINNFLIIGDFKIEIIDKEYEDFESWSQGLCEEIERILNMFYKFKKIEEVEYIFKRK